MGKVRITQKEKILAYLKEHGKITDAEAYNLFACRRCGARIWDLRSEGYLITTVRTTKKNRFGQYTTFATYVLED